LLLVYRNNTKNDKAKKERAEKAAATASAKGKAKEIDPNVSPSISISVAPKSKSKAPTSATGGASSVSAQMSTPDAMLPPPFTSAPLLPATSIDPNASSAQPQHVVQREENDEMEVEEEEGADDEDVDIDVDVDEVDDDEGEGVEEIQDMMALEEEEVRKDAKGLEERVGDD